MIIVKDPEKQSRRLTKSMYGDLKCKAFDISNGQMRHDAIIKSAGWYTHKGDRLGNGDLSLFDMQVISIAINPDDVFIVLSELDSMWDMPSELDHSSPGQDYVLQKAIWIIGHTKELGGTIIRVRNDITKLEEIEKDNIKYLRMPREDSYKSLGYTFKKIDLSGGKSKEEKKEDPIKSIESKLKAATKKMKSLSSSVVSKSNPIPPMPANHYIGMLPNGQVGAIPVPATNAKPTNPIPIPSTTPKTIKKMKKLP